MTVPYCYHVAYAGDMLARINQNWVRLWIVKKLKSWERLTEYDYQCYTVLNTMTGTSKTEVCPEYREEVKGEVRCVKSV